MQTNAQSPQLITEAEQDALDSAVQSLADMAAHAPKRNLVEVTIAVSLDEIDFGHFLTHRDASYG